MKHCHKLMVSEHLFHINANKTDNGHCRAIKTNTFQKNKWFYFILLTLCRIFAEDKLHSGNQEQVLFPLICNIFAEDKLHSGNQEQVLFPLICSFFAEDKVRFGSIRYGKHPFLRTVGAYILHWLCRRQYTIGKLRNRLSFCLPLLSLHHNFICRWKKHYLSSYWQ